MEPGPLELLTRASELLRETTGLLWPHYQHSHEGVDFWALLHLLEATSAPNPKGFLISDAHVTGGHSLWTFFLKLLGPRCLGRRCSTESSTWAALSSAVTKVDKGEIRVS